MNDTEKSQLVEKLRHTFEGEQSPIEPALAQLTALAETDNNGPWHFVNLLSFHSEAQYPEGHELHGQGLSGEQAYNKYGKVAFDHVTRRGGELITLNTVHYTVIGQPGVWQRLATMKYPDTAAFLDMVQDPDYRAALVHRNAGLKETMLLASQPMM